MSTRKKQSPSEIIDAVLTAITADPGTAGRVIGTATDGKHGDHIWKMIKADTRFGAPVRAALRKPGVLRDAPWIVQLLGHLRYAPAVPELLALWRRGTNADQVGRAILDIGDVAGMNALARDVKKASEGTRYLAIRAAIRLDAAGAFTVLAPLVKKRHRGAADVFEAIVEDTKLVRDKRWRSLALEMIRARRNDVVEHAWALLRKSLSPAELGRALASIAPRTKPPSIAERAARQKALATARTAMAPTLDALAKKKGVRRAAKTAARTLASIEALVGPIPASVYAFYERIASVAVGPRTSGVIIVPLAEVASDAKSWAEQWGAPHAPRSLVPPFSFPVSPDPSTRRGYSGGPAYGFEIPTRDDDPRVEGVRGNPRFSELVARAAK